MQVNRMSRAEAAITIKQNKTKNFWPQVGNIAVAGMAWVVIPHELGWNGDGFKFNSWRIFVVMSAIPSLLVAIRYIQGYVFNLLSSFRGVLSPLLNPPLPISGLFVWSANLFLKFLFAESIKIKESSGNIYVVWLTSIRKDESCLVISNFKWNLLLSV